MNLEVNNIIIRMPNWLGDCVMATPVLQDVRERFPRALITVMVYDRIAPLLQKDPNIDELFFFSKPSGGFFLRRRETSNIISLIQNGKYDLGILLTNSFSSAWWFLRGKVRMRLGYASDLRSFLLTKAVPFAKHRSSQHLVETYKDLLEPLGISKTKSVPKLYVTDEEIVEARGVLQRQGFKEGMTLVGINPGAAYGPAKCWPQERFRDLAKKLLEDESLFLVFFGDEKTLPLIKGITANLPPRACNLAGLTSTRELMALIAVCDLFLTNDSGPMHIAAALGTPLIAIFGSTSEIVTGPYKTGKVIHKHVECSPCYKRVCPIDFRCMKRIEVDEVYEEIKRCLNRSMKRPL